MITEIAVLYIREKENDLFEQAFEEAQKIISAMSGYLGHELQHCMGQDNKYVLIVRWAKATDHTEGFRKSDQYKEWKGLLHHFYHPFPVVEHYKKIC